VFDQSGQGPLSDGEADEVSGTTATCTPMPGPAANLALDTMNSDADLKLTWDDAANADDYLVFSDASPNGAFSTVAGIASSGSTGLTVGTPSGIEFYLVAGRNRTCGIGPKR